MDDEITTLTDWSLVLLEDGRRCITTQHDCANDLKQVITTVAKIVQSREALFRTEKEGRRTLVVATELGKEFFQCIKADLAGIDKHYPTHRFSPFYTVFKQHAKSLWKGSCRIGLSMVDELNAAVEAIRAAGRETKLKIRIENLKRCERSNARSMKDLLAGVRRLYSKVLIIRLDLEYFSVFGPGCGFNAQEISLEQVQQHRNAFLEYLRTGPYSENLAGYAWKLEWGPEKGFHIHFVIFKDAQAVCKDIVIADMLSKYWREVVTASAGYAHNCNKDKERYPEPYLGMVARGDDAKWEVAGEKLRYLTKVDHFVRFQAPRKCKTFDTGGPYKKA